MTAPEWIRYAAKAVLAAAIAGIGCLATGFVDDTLTTAEALTAAGAALTAAGAVYGIPNTAKGDGYRPRHAPKGGSGHAGQ